MPSFKIATWNVNSLRVRLPHILTWLESYQPDVLAVQETKLLDEHFPFDVLQEAGYTSVYAGQKTYNGVAIFSKHPVIEVITDLPNLVDPQRRILGVTIQGIRIYNFYVPNGESTVSQKYTYKLNWLQNITAYLQETIKRYPRTIILGDFNIAPAPLDVYDPVAWEGKVLFSKPEREAFQNILQLGFNDCYRELNPHEKNYSWWDYRVNAFKRNLGMRIDHILATTALSAACTHCHIDKTPRSWERPSDHTPVIATFTV